MARRAPAGAVQTLHSHVARLRRQLPRDAIQTTPEGYRLEAEVDAAQLEAALRAGDGRMLRDLLMAWEAPAYDGLADDGVLAREAYRLDALRSPATQLVARQALAGGELDGITAVLESALAEEPTDEPLGSCWCWSWPARGARPRLSRPSSGPVTRCVTTSGSIPARHCAGPSTTC